ncbi:MAG: hypothetical protein EBR82_73755 [Caulobacteraceae bacterium]|nr:hypothetical protein [Caulobacteraceae bacterium]
MRPCFACKQRKDAFYLVTLPLSPEEEQQAIAEEADGDFSRTYPQLCLECISILVGKAALKYRIGKEAVLTLVSDNAIINLTKQESA